MIGMTIHTGVIPAKITVAHGTVQYAGIYTKWAAGAALVTADSVKKKCPRTGKIDCAIYFYTCEKLIAYNGQLTAISQQHESI
jgi:hypothetical protein